MKNILILLIVVIGSSIAAMLYYEKSDPVESVADNSEQAADMPVISTAPEAKQNAESDETAVSETDAENAKPEEAVAQAEEKAEAEPKAETGELDRAAKIAVLAKALGGIPNSSIKAAPMEGWYEVANGSAIGYISEDGKYLIDGDLIDLTTRTNLTDQRRNGWRKSVIAGVDESKMIIFEPKEVKHTITVFTDVDCGYCRKLHSQMDEYLAEGIRIRYIFYPLRGESAPSFKTAENVWCSDNRQEAMTQAKLGKAVKAEACENPVAMHLQTGVTLGIRGTPGVITEEGRLLPGYMPPKTLLAELQK